MADVEEALSETVPAGALPRTEIEIVAAAARRGFDIPQACMPGVVTNLALLASHADCLLGGNRAS